MKKLKAKQEITIDYAFQWWKWMEPFCARTRYTNRPQPYVEVGKNYETFKIGDFENFCDYLTKYKYVRIV